MKNFAAIDIGTNSFHLIVVKVSDTGNFEIIDREKEVIRLGEGSSGDMKFINESAVGRAVASLKRFKGIADSHKAEIRAVATSAVRESLNKNEFIEEVLKETGIEIEVIGGDEEARLIYLGMLKAVPIYDKTILGIDIGGGSTEFVIGKKGKIIYSMSLKLGAVRLTQKFFPGFNITKNGIKQCRKWVRGEIYHVKEKLQSIDINMFTGSSGTIMSAGLMISALRTGEAPESIILNNFVFTNKELSEISKIILSKEKVADRKKIIGLDPKRADIIPAGIIILSTIFESFGLNNLTISGYALREGIVIDTIHKFEDRSIKPKLRDIRFESVKHLSDSCNYAVKHCKHVSKLALQLFDQLKKLHGLEKSCREYLEAAAILHDIGYHISHSQHHRHSNYIIRNSQLLGFNENEINIISNVARYHRKSHPKNRHKDFSQLPEKSQQVVLKLAALLRIADALDRTHSNKIENIQVKTNKREVRAEISYTGKIPEIEIWNFERRKALFEEVFGKKILLVYNNN